MLVLSLRYLGQNANTEGQTTGALLYTYVFKEGFAPLIVVSALATLAYWLLIPLLPEADQHKEETGLKTGNGDKALT
jgi:hypothetical protein